MALALTFALPAMAIDASNTGNVNGNDDAVSAPVTPVIAPTQPEIANGADDDITPPTSSVNPVAPVAEVMNGDDDVHVADVTPTPENPGGGGGTPEVVNRSSGSGGSGSFSSSGSRPTNLPAVVTITSCPLITDYLKFGAINDGVQVARLQAFLKNAEKLDVDVTGIFDQKTEDAVKAFQLKYLPTILGPWDATKATGFVYITTKKQLNALACASPLTLSADDQTIIDAYKARGTAAPAESSVEGGTETTTPSETPPVEVGTVGTSTSENVAAVGEASVLSRFLNYIKNLFR